MESIQQYIKEQKTLLEQTLREMALIKAPTGHEKKRAEYCVEWLQAQGIEEVLSDECTNVIVPWNIQSGKNNCMFMAHLDTVFSEETELMIKEMPILVYGHYWEMKNAVLLQEKLLMNPLC